MVDQVLGDVLTEWDGVIVPQPTYTWNSEDEDEVVSEIAPLAAPYIPEVPNAWTNAWKRCIALLSSYGLVGPKLAVQSGKEEDLLLQLLVEMSYTPEPAEQYWLLDKMQRLVEVALQGEPLAKRLRGELGPLASQRMDDAVLAQPQASSSSTSGFPGITLPRRGTRRSSRLTAADPENVDRAVLLIHVQLERLMEAASMPAIEMARKTTDPQKTLRLVFGSTRLGTMKKYLKYLLRMERFMLQSFGFSWPVAEWQYIDFVQALLDEPAAPSIPQTSFQALAWLEKCGGVGAQAISRNAMVLKVTDAATVILAEGKSPAWQAPRFPSVLIASMELYWQDTAHDDYLRLVAGSHLFRAWGTLRLNDIQNISARALKRLGQLIVGTLMITKTSGPGKRNRELPLSVDLNLSLIGLSWLPEWLAMLEKLPNASTATFLVPRDIRYSKNIEAAPTYAEVSAASGRMFRELKVPVFCGLKNTWCEGEELLCPAGLKGFFTEHSGRSFLPSICAVLESDKDRRDMLGRWSPSGSDDYARTARQVVGTLQRTACGSLLAGLGCTSLDESDVVERLRRHLLERKGLSPEATQEICVVFADRIKSFHVTLAGQGRSLIEFDAQRAQVPEATVHLDSAATSAAEALRKDLRPRMPPGEAHDFVLVYGRGRKFARLHKAKGGCHWASLALVDSVSVQFVDESMYNAKCKLCWPCKAKAKALSHEGNSSTGSESSSSESSLPP